MLSAFSLYRSTSKLLAPAESEEIPCIHGVRAIATIALLIVHKFLPVAVIPYSNRSKIAELVRSPLWSWSRAGWVFTDCFLLLSGALTARRAATDADTGAPQRLLARYLRLTPALLAVVLFYSYVWDQLSTGPMWGTLVIKNAEVCRDGWWWNLLYVQNYFGFEDICAPQTHQLALDMQLTVLGCVIVWVMTQVKPRLSAALLPALHMVAAYSRYTTVRDHRLTFLFYHGVSVSQLYRTARLSYSSTLHRSTAYLVGISLGLALQKPAIRNKFLVTVGWLWCVALWAGVWWAGADAGSPQYHYRADQAALYAALAPIASAIAIAWLIYAVHNDHSELLLRFLCCRPLVLISRLSYALYLTQFAVFLTNAATVKSSSEFSLVSLIDIQEMAIIILASGILTLTFVIPMQSLHKIFIFKDKEEMIKDASEDKDLKTKEENNISRFNLNANNKISEIKEVLPTKNKVSFVAHREPLEEIPEVEIEYEMRREMNDGLDEILEEEEEDADLVEDDNIDVEEPDEMGDEIGGDDDYVEPRDFVPRTRYYMEDEQDLEEWEWTKTDGPNGGQND